MCLHLRTEETIIKELVVMCAESIGLKLKGNDLQDIYLAYEKGKNSQDIQTLLFTELYRLQELRVENEKSSLVSI